MDLIEYEFTKPRITKLVITKYLLGYSTQDIRIMTKLDDSLIDNIIDCYNYLHN